MGWRDWYSSIWSHRGWASTRAFLGWNPRRILLGGVFTEGVGFLMLRNQVKAWCREDDIDECDNVLETVKQFKCSWCSLSNNNKHVHHSPSQALGGSFPASWPQSSPPPPSREVLAVEPTKRRVQPLQFPLPVVSSAFMQNWKRLERSGLS